MIEPADDRRPVGDTTHLPDNSPPSQTEQPSAGRWATINSTLMIYMMLSSQLLCYCQISLVYHLNVERLRTWKLTSEVYKFILFLCLKFPWKGQIQAEYQLRDYMQPSKSEPEKEINASSLSLENNPILGKSCNSVIYTIPVNKINTVIIRQTREPQGQSTTKSGKVLPMSHISNKK